MSLKLRNLLLWVIAVLFTLTIVIYQRKTGPTYPVSGKKNLWGTEIAYKLLRSQGGVDGALISITIPDKTINGKIKYMRYNSYDTWTWVSMSRDGEVLTARLPHQPPAGKIIYQVFCERDGETISLTDSPVVIRFKGDVPASVLIPHILFMFLAMLASTRAGLEAIFKGGKTYQLTFLTLASLFIGGIVLGPLVQKYAFNAYWTGWPLGNDLTDNKTLVSFALWVVAFIRMSRTKKSFVWVLVASIVLLAVYLIPHSLLGSELDYTKIQ